jgi:predicted nucleic acid-binding protein
MVFYVDTSAMLKLAFLEAESAALRRWIDDDRPVLVGSDLVRTETLRAARKRDAESVESALRALEIVALLSTPRIAFRRAAEIGPDVLKSLDALHLATALELGDELTGMVTYDKRLSAGCIAHGIRVLAPV